MTSPKKKTRQDPSDLAPATISEADGVRYLHLGTPWVQGAMRIRKAQAIELDYVQRMMVWMLLRPEAELCQGHAVQLGLGAAAITRFCHGVMGLRTTAVELNPTVIAACRIWFHLPPDSDTLSILERDAADHVADPALAGSAQVLCVDLYDHDAASPVLDSEDFYRGCHRLLSPGGVMTVNLFGRDASFEHSARRIVAAFGADHVFNVQPTQEGNTVVVGMKDLCLPDPPTLLARAEAIEARFKLPARRWVKMLRALPTSVTAPN